MISLKLTGISKTAVQARHGSQKHNSVNVSRYLFKTVQKTRVETQSQ